MNSLYCVVKTERYWVEANSDDEAIGIVNELDNSSADDVNYEAFSFKNYQEKVSA